ncbi:MAG: CYTH domain-containing protein [Paludibacteraceae bacterium]|nr:CYTH domain-containing protein [Paludibacteraceae bacterium]
MKNTEIEHKYLVSSVAYRTMATAVHTIKQGYLCTDPDCTIRIRQKDDKAYITVKSKPADNLSRFEWEKEISLDDAQNLFPLCKTAMIEKERYIVPWQELTIEIDEFHGENEGLILAEIELQTPNQIIPPLPDFIGQDVSHDARYYNSNLINNPYKNW